MTQFCVEEAVFERVTLQDRRAQAEAASFASESFHPDLPAEEPDELSAARAAAERFRRGL